MTTSCLGMRVPRVDGADKVTGAARFGADVSIPGSLHVRLVLSPHAHARIVSVDCAAAQAVPGVVAVVTWPDLAPTVKTPATSRARDLLANGTVRYYGQPVVAVLAESEVAAEDAAALVDVEYHPLPATLDPIAAMQPGAAPIWPGGSPGVSAEAAEHGIDPLGPASRASSSPNVTGSLEHSRGDVEAGLREADVVIERRYHTAPVHQGYLEPHACTAALDPMGTLTVWTSTQGVFFPRGEVAAVLGWPEQRVRLVPTAIGGGFGAKGTLLEPLAAVLAVQYRRPVSIVMTRMEEFLAATPAPGAVIDLRLGAKRDGTLLALDATIVFNSGAFTGTPLPNACQYLGAFYQWRDLRVRAFEVVTNTTPQGAYRGPGGPQGIYATESAVDDAARALGMDPFELRLKNVAEVDAPMADGKPWPPIGLRQCLERLREHPAWRDRRTVANEGIGISCGGLYHGLQGGSAFCRLEADGSLTVVVGSVDISGTNTGLALIAADAFGIAPDRVQVTNADSDAAPFSPMAGGSKITFAVGGGVMEAARDARQQVFQIAADQLEAAADDLEIVDGQVRVKGAEHRAIGLDRVGQLSVAIGSRYLPVLGRGSQAMLERAPGTAAHLARVRVDPDTHAASVVEYVAIQDVGKAINPAGIEGQIHGGVSQGIGWALYEAMAYDEAGTVQSASFLDYTLPSTDKIPSIQTEIVEVPSRSGPYGLRGVGEPPLIPVAAAIANAIRDATGVRLTELPMTAERIHRAVTAGAKESPE
ncbi:MAG: xanthine dehydrogenase family protein molybdopterin-binding subunit [Chloroflexota bacterium]